MNREALNHEPIARSPLHIKPQIKDTPEYAEYMSKIGVIKTDSGMSDQQSKLLSECGRCRQISKQTYYRSVKRLLSVLHQTNKTASNKQKAEWLNDQGLRAWQSQKWNGRTVQAVMNTTDIAPKGLE